MAKIAINGFGRIGRLFFRQAMENKDLDIIAINDLGDPENLAYLLKYDSVYRRYSKDIKLEGNTLIVDEKRIKLFQEREISNLPWKDLGIDIVIEATGVFTTFKKAYAHVKDAGAKRVILTAPAKDEEGTEGGKTVLMGVNHDSLKTCLISSNGSCTTNASSPVMAIMQETIGVEKAMLNTIHGYTATQSLTDGPTKKKGDFRKGRAAAQNIIPATTGAAIALSRALPELEGKFDGIALRVPVINGSIADITFISKKDTTIEEVNEIFKKAEKDPRWKNILKVVNDQVVSSDLIGESYGAIIDLTYTRVVGGNLVKVLSWYDNEWGYVSTLVLHTLEAAKTT